MDTSPLITFPPSTGLPFSVTNAWGIYDPDRQAESRLFVLENEEEASCIDIYEPTSQFHIAITQGSVKQCQDWVNRHYKLPPEDHFTLKATGKAHCFTFNKRRLIIIWLCIPSRADAPLVFSLCAHECLHATYAIMDSIGMKPDFANEEYTAYTLQFLMQNYIQCIGLPIPIES
ncbi:MAG: hypothetical protein J0L73_28490 [Verrucomicrobia bacterium]|nr:hypothetical protein [Verrucomicrobiota bacterium]